MAKIDELLNYLQSWNNEFDKQYRVQVVKQNLRQLLLAGVPPTDIKEELSARFDIAATPDAKDAWDICRQQMLDYINKITE